MAQYIYKYTVPIDDQVHSHDLTFFSRVLAVGQQRPGELVFWAVFDDDQPASAAHRRHFQVVGTGQPLPDGAVHRGAVQDGVFVWHLVEL